jgi:hypothetical protein
MSSERAPGRLKSGGHFHETQLFRNPECYIFLNQFATARGSNLTHVPILKHGMRPAAACLKIVTLDTERSPARSSAVKAWPVFSI